MICREVTGPMFGGWLDENFDYSLTVTIMASFSALGVSFQLYIVL